MNFKEEFIGKYYYESLLDKNRNKLDDDPEGWNHKHFVEILDDHRIRTNFWKYTEHISWYKKEDMIFRIQQGWTYDKERSDEKVFPVKWLTDDMRVEIGDDYLILFASESFNKSAGFVGVQLYRFDLLFRKVKEK